MKVFTEEEKNYWIDLALRTNLEMGNGCSRVVFKAGENCVVKFAPEVSGKIQQRNEVSFYQNVKNTCEEDLKYFGEIIGYSEDYRIVVMEFIDEDYDSCLPFEERNHFFDVLDKYHLSDGIQGGLDKNGNYKIYDMGLTKGATKCFNDLEEIYYEEDEYLRNIGVFDMGERKVPPLITFLKRYKESGFVIDFGY